MRDSNLPESDLLKSVLQPLLEDFKYWEGAIANFARNRTVIIFGSAGAF
jgi:hypothetical protein